MLQHERGLAVPTPTEDEHVKRWTFMIVGIVLLIAGVIFMLQGLDVLGGNGGMNGNKTWAVLGPIIAIVGIVALVTGARARSRSSVR